MNWVIEHLQIIIGVAAAIAYFLNRRRTAAAEEDSPVAPTAESLEHEERTRQIQAEIRRKIAERRAAAGGPKQEGSLREMIPPPLPQRRVPPLDPFGGPMRKILTEIERAANKEAPPPYDPTVAETTVLERQKALQEQLQALEAARAAEQRRATEIAAARHAARKHVSPEVTVEAGDLRARLRDTKELRRAMVLRELLGAPLALR